MMLTESQQHLIAGTAGGMIATATLYPLELVKTRMQVLESSSVHQKGVYSGFFSAVRTILHTEGMPGFYRGLVPAIIGASGSWGGYFTVYEMSKKRKLRKYQESLDLYHSVDGSAGITGVAGRDKYTPIAKLHVTDHLLSGVEAGVVLVVLFNPIWLIKTRLAVQDATTVDLDPALFKGKGVAARTTSNYSGSNSASPSGSVTSVGMKSVSSGGTAGVAQQAQAKKYSGLIDAVKTIYREEGVVGFYKGLLPALLLTTHGAIQFAAYEQLKAMSAALRSSSSSRNNNNNNNNNSSIEEGRHHEEQPALVSALIGGASKVIASTATYPYQVIKSKLQQRDSIASPTTPPSAPSIDSNSQSQSNSQINHNSQSSNQYSQSSRQSSQLQNSVAGAPEVGRVAYHKETAANGVTSSTSSSSSSSSGNNVGATLPHQEGGRMEGTRVKVGKSNVYQQRYTSTWDCAVKIWRKEGIRGFFRGALPNALKVAPSSAMTFLVYEECLKIMRDR